MNIVALWRRVLAWGVDAILALMVTGILMIPLTTLSNPSNWQGSNPVPAVWAVSFILLALLLQGETPGKRWMKLHLSGQGCLICRELRRSGWTLILSLEALLAERLPFGVPDALVGIGLGFLLWSIAEPLISRAQDFPHNRMTGFSIEA
ncbi:MAG: RDD family protein [Aliishimia sp.]